MPTLIYLVRMGLVYLAAGFEFSLPNALMNHRPPSTWFIPKTGYVFFCLPGLVIACKQLSYIFQEKNKQLNWLVIVYIATIIGTLLVFYFEDIKNGFAYSLFFILFILTRTLLIRKVKLNFSNAILIFGGFILFFYLISQHFQKNDSWRTFFADAKIAAQLDDVDHWKYAGAKGYPQNELGQVVSISNYERQTWSIAAVRMILESPEGYGLVWKSFGYMGKERWPDSVLTQSHSGWLDLILGIGAPGVLLLLLAQVLALKNALKIRDNFWAGIALWISLAIALLMLTTEVSQSLYINAVFFLVFWTAGLGLRATPNKHFHGSV
jgi:hypothetical protein